MSAGVVELRRGLHFRTLVSTSTGLAFAAIQYLAVASLLTVVAGRLAWLAVLVGGVLVLMAWSFFSELCGMFPTAAAIRRYMSASMPENTALGITFTYMTSIILVMAADAYIVGSAIANALNEPTWLVSFYIAALLGAATLANLRGVVVAGAVQDIATYIILGVTAVIGVFACFHPPTAVAHALDATRPTTVSGFVQAVALGILLFSAFEWVTTSAEEVIDVKQIPKAMLIAIAILASTCAVLTYGMSKLLSHSELTSAFPQLYLGRHVAGAFGYGVMAFITALTALDTFNGGFITASRFIYSAAREGALPRSAAKLNNNAVPWVPVVGLAGAALVVSVAVSLTHAWLVLLSVGACLESMIFAVAGFCVLRLRQRLPDAERPFRIRAVRFVGKAGVVVFGLLAVVSGVSVNNKFDIRPLLIIAVVGGLCVTYVLVYIPKLRAAEQERLAAAGPRRRRPTAVSEDA